jgi:broad specificity phosphatase PhoE/ParB-like chromosome segregation protein Spo0J
MPTLKQTEAGATEVLKGAGDVATPLMIAGAVAQPELTVAALLGGTAGEYGGGKLADAVKASPETKELLQQVGGLAGAVAGGGAYGGAKAAVDPTDALADLLWKRGYIEVNGQPIHIQSQGEAMAVAKEMIKQNPQGFVDSIRNGYSWSHAAKNVPARQFMGIAEPAGMPPGLPGQVVPGEATPVEATAPPQTPAPPPVEPMHSITSEEIAHIGDTLAQLPLDQRPQATLAAHGALAGLLLQQGKFIGPDGKLQIISNQKQAESLAQKYINEEIGRQDAAAKKSASEPVPAPPPGFTIEQPAQSEAQPTQAQSFAVGDRVVLPKGDVGTVAHSNSRLIRVALDGGGKASVPAERWDSVRGAGVQSGNEPPHTRAGTIRSAGSLPTQSDVAPAEANIAEESTVNVPAVSGEHNTSEVRIEQISKSDASKGEIIFARHGETKLDLAGANETVAGWTPEPLDERGVAAAHKLAGQLKDSGATTIVTSDLPRAKQTAEIVGKQLGIPVTEDSRLRPQHVPETEGLKVGDASPIWNSYENAPDKKPEGGESWNEARARQDAALKDVNALVAKGERPVVVTHSRNLEMELGEKPKPGGFVATGLHEEGGAVEPGKVESGNGNATRLHRTERAEGAGEARPVLSAGVGSNGAPTQTGTGEKGSPTGETAETPKYKFGSAGRAGAVEPGKVESGNASQSRADVFGRSRVPEGSGLTQRGAEPGVGGRTASPIGGPHGNSPVASHGGTGGVVSNSARVPGDILPGGDKSTAVEEQPKYKFGSTQANIPAESEASKALESARARISEADLEKKMGGPLTRTSAEVAPGKVGEMKLSDLKVAPAKFQYKLSTDAEGVGALLKETKVWNPDLAGIISVWRDPADGKTYVVNGHHRYELAKRLGVKSVTVRHIVASSAKVARSIGAEQNIADGRGSALDAAKYFRDSGITPEELKEKGISLGEATVAKGVALSNLSEPIFNRVVQGDLTQGRAIAIGEATADPAEQKAALDLVERKERAGRKVSDDTLAELIRLVKSSGQTTETTADLFGTQQINRSLALEKAEISAHIKQQLQRDKKLFGFVAKGDRATELARAGNKIDVEKSKEISTGAAQAEEVYNRLSERGGPIAGILEEAARKLADGDNAQSVKSDAYQRVRTEVSQTLGAGERRSAGGHEGAPETKPDTGTNLFSPETELAPSAIHSLPVTPEMRKSVLSEGQPLFSTASDPVPPATAKGATFEVKPTQPGLPSYLRLNTEAAEAINRAVGVRMNGVNIDATMVPEVVTKLKADGDRLGGAAKENLYKLADAMLAHTDKEFGLSVIRSGPDEAKELATLHEEMLHSAQRKAGRGNITAGTPWKEALSDEGIVKMAADRIVPDLVKNGLKPRADVVVAEAMVDLLRGDAVRDLTPEQIEVSSQKYFAAMAAQSGIESVEAIQKVQDYIARLKEEKGISYGEAAERARDAGQRGLTKALEGLRAERDARGRGGEIAPSRKGLPGKTNRGEPGGGGTSSLANADRRPRESWRSPVPAERTSTTLHSTQPIGLSDEELEDWSKSKGFRVEPAGEQLDIFGGNQPVMRVFRSGRGGKEQKALVYQSQLDQLKEAKPGPTEPFALTGGESRQEQPRLFGANDLGEIIGSGKGSGITLPGREKPTSLFSGESDEARPGELARTVTEAAGQVGEYLREVKRNTDHARDLQRGLETLDTSKQADILRGIQIMKTMKSAGMTKADDEAVYHHLENPEGVELHGKQDKWLDDIILPIQSQNEDLYKELTDGGVPIENYVHRVVKGKGGMLDRIATGARGVGTKGSLSKSAPQTKGRTYMALEDRAGKRMVVSVKGGQVAAWDHGTPENLGGISKTDEGQVFEDKDGHIWNLRQATTKEIEQHTETEYYHSALASSIASNIQLNSAVRAMRFLEAYKGSPEFKEIAWKGTGNPPQGWHPTKLQQFAGYYFEPRTAEVLDDYYDRMRNGQFGVMQSIQKFLRAAYLMNPIVHPLNVAASWAFEKGLTGFAPWKWKAVYKSGNKAVKAVLTKNQDYLDALDAGAALQSHREELQDIHKLFFDRLAEGLDKKESWAMDVAKALGIEHGNLLNLLHKPSSLAAWFSSDVMYLQAAYQYQMEHPGVELKDALKEAGRIIPEYRVPTRILDNRLASKAMTNPLISWFGAYHYGLLKSFAEAGKAALGAQKPTEGRTKAEEVAKGWDRLAMLGLITMVLYPLLDQLAKKETGDEHARVRRSGPAGYVDSAEQVAEHKQDVSSAAQKVLTPSPITKGAAELAFNRDFFTGHQIYDPHADWRTQANEVGHYLLGDFGVAGQYQKAETSAQKRRFLWQQAGVQFGKSRAEKVAGDIAASKVGTEAESPEDHANRVERREILDQLRQGNRKPLQDAQAKHGLTHRQVLNLEHRARLDPLEDTVHNFTVEETERVLKAARADKDDKEISLLENILRRKISRANAGGARYSWQKELAGAAR